MSDRLWDSILKLPSPVRSKRISFSGDLASGETKDFRFVGKGCVNHWWFTYMFYMAADAGQKDSLKDVHNIRLQIYFDGDAEAAVDQPLATFFGTFLDQEPIMIDSAPITVLKRNGFNCWFPMPFERSVEFRFTNEDEKKTVMWFMMDIHLFDPAAELTKLRFGTAYKKLDPAPDYSFMTMADLRGRGFIAGMFHGTDARGKTDSWYHTGGDTWLLDGESDPGVIRGNGGEDLVGYSFGIYRSQHAWQGAPYIDNEQGVGNGGTPCIFYRFFGPDPIIFHNSAWCKFGTKEARIETNVYYYLDQSSQTDLGRTVEQWQLCAPFDGSSWDAFEQAEFPESEGPSDRRFGTTLHSWQPNPKKLQYHQPYEGRWVQASSHKGWIDFLDCYRGINFANHAAGGEGGAAYALGHLHSDKDEEVELLLSFDDWMKVWVNDELISVIRHDWGFQTVAIRVKLREGNNKILLKLSNSVNMEFFAWAFHLKVTGR